MSKNSTNHDIIRYIYNELEESKKQKLTIETLIDTSAKETLELFSLVKDELDRCMLMPSDSVVEKIKSYSNSNRRYTETA